MIRYLVTESEEVLGHEGADEASSTSDEDAVGHEHSWTT
jgi:hypothetical protein